MLWLHNLKKSKGQYVSFGIIIIITALIVNIALVLAAQFSDAYNKRFDELNAAQINVLVPHAFDTDDLMDDLTAISGVTSTERHEGIFASATVREFQGSDFDMNTVFYNLDEDRTVNKLEVSEYNDKNAVYVPVYITELGMLPVGKDITYTIDGDDYTWKIGGTVSEMQYGNYGTGMIGAYLPEALYNEFKEDMNGKTEVAEYSLKTNDGADYAVIKSDISEKLSEKHIPLLSIIDKESAKQSRTMVCRLLIAIFIALAAIILIVSIFLSNFKIRNTIDEEMTQMGVLKALGYTSSQIITGAVVPYFLTGLAATLVGAALSYLLLPTVANILAVQSGFSFTPAFDFLSLAVTICVPVLAILLFAYLAARKIYTLEPINAIRGITKAAHKNHFPLETTKLGVKPALVLKQTASSMGQNILLFAVSFGIMVLMSFAATLVFNVVVNPRNFTDTLQEETPSVIVTAENDDLREILENDSRVDMVLEYSTVKASYAGGSITAFVCEDFGKVTNDICYDGKNPANENEIALGSAHMEKYSIGDKVEITVDGNAAKYTVTGFVQSINNNGNVCELTKSGYERLTEDKEVKPVYNVYLKEKGAEDFIKEYERDHDDLISSTINYEKMSEQGIAMYSSIVSIVTIVLLLISILVALLVMYVIISSMLTRRRQELGIYKAIGYSASQLIKQTSMSFIPSIAIGAVLSAILGIAYMPALDKGIFSLLGAYKNHFEISLLLMLLFAVIFTAICYLIGVILSKPIKKITAYSLLKE